MTITAQQLRTRDPLPFVLESDDGGHFDVVVAERRGGRVSGWARGRSTGVLVAFTQTGTRPKGAWLRCRFNEAEENPRLPGVVRPSLLGTFGGRMPVALWREAAR